MHSTSVTGCRAEQLRRFAAACAGIALALTLCPAYASGQATVTPPANPPAAVTFDQSVDVVGVTPILGLGVPIVMIPATVRVATSRDVAASGADQTAGFLTGAFAGVHANDTQANPFQPDMQFRGFVGSPLLGASQGIAVYQDGVRMNEPFGDTLQWSLLPTPNAIASMNLMPGSNPLFGLNALGGALSIQTKTGFTHPGHAAAISAGSFGRRWADVESGGRTDRLSYFIAARALAEDGWRHSSSSEVLHLFANASWRDAGATAFDLSAMGGRNRLRGNGPAPVQLLERDRGAVFTHPDESNIDHLLLSLRGRRAITARISIDGVLSYRPATFRTFNGDDSDYEPCEDDPGRLCAGNEPVFDVSGLPVRAPDDPFDAANNSSVTRTEGTGASIQVTMTQPLGRRDNFFIAGLSVDGGDARFTSRTELARLLATRGTAGSGLVDAGSLVAVRTRVRHVGVYAADFFPMTSRLTVSAAARYSHSTLRLRDQIGTELDGDHRFARFSPAGGVTFDMRQGVTVYGSVSMSSRVPTPSEVSCADPEDPCRLPNAFVSDPPLRQVVSRTWESGVRGRRQGLEWSAAVFRTTNSDDLQFISSGALTNEGYFANVGDTIRSGLELQFGGHLLGVRWTAAYTHLRATYATPLTLGSEHHPGAVDGEIQVRAGASLPAVPRHVAVADATRTFGKASVGVSALFSSSAFLRGDESNALPKLPGYAVAHIRAQYAVTRRVSVVGDITNLFNSDHATFGLLGDADGVLGDAFDQPQFVSPAAPRAAWVGVAFTFGSAPAAPPVQDGAGPTGRALRPTDARRHRRVP